MDSSLYLWRKPHLPSGCVCWILCLATRTCACTRGSVVPVGDLRLLGAAKWSPSHRGTNSGLDIGTSLNCKCFAFLIAAL
ncbi:hypothetical protein JB92DRAFT_1701306 [Gautieria morchelliformis]|nr:hypothetical protein JB92DRAFT_1701306 [Gautieria morchelliformis]